MSLLRKPKFVLGTIALLAIVVGSRLLFKVPLPHIQLAPEALFYLGPVPFTNTMLALVIAEAALLLVAIAATRRMELVPTGKQNFFEAVVEFWQNQSVQLIGEKATRTYLPLVLTIFLVIWAANYSHFVPGFDSVGVLCQAGSCPGEESLPPDRLPKHTHFDVHWTGAEGEGLGLIEWRSEEGPSGILQRWLQQRTAGPQARPDEVAADVRGDEHAADAAASAGAHPGEADAHDEAHHGYALIPYLRVPTSDLNLTLALALVAVVAVEIAGFRVNGLRYVTKFVHIDFGYGLFQGVLNVFVGLIELVSELSRVISFAFRLFGNIFAGQVLMFVFPFLLPLLAVLPIYALELFVGLIQAFVFAILTLAFISLAIAPPHGEQH